jgi:hypothetical protein
VAIGARTDRHHRRAGTGYSACWIGQIARRYNTAGPGVVRDQRPQARARHLLLTDERYVPLRTALAEAPPAGEHWCGRMVAAWMSAHLGRNVSRQAAWRATAFGRTLPQAAPTSHPGQAQRASVLQGASAHAAARGRHSLSSSHSPELPQPVRLTDRRRRRSGAGIHTHDVPSSAETRSRRRGVRQHEPRAHSLLHWRRAPPRRVTRAGLEHTGAWPHLVHDQAALSGIVRCGSWEQSK